MTLVRYGQTAMIAAILVLSGNAVRAQQASEQSPTLKAITFTIKSACCKDGKCCKEGESCCASKKCDAKCSCAKDSKCACCKDGDCCCDKNGKCSCSKDKTSAAKTGCGCPIMDLLAKKTAIIMVMPASMPLPACCMEAMGILPHPPMPMPPPGPHVFLPPPMPPIPPFPPTPSMGLAGMPPMPIEPPAPMYYGNTVYGYAPAPATVCSTTTASNSKMEITAPPSCDQLQMSIGEDNAIRCKKMTVKIGDNVISVSRFDDRVRVRGDELKATANSVRCDSQGHLILDGDVVLHCKKGGHVSTHGDRIELDLSNCAMMIQRTAAKALPAPTYHTNVLPNPR
jgi:hypothetical protein